MAQHDTLEGVNMAGTSKLKSADEVQEEARESVIQSLVSGLREAKRSARDRRARQKNYLQEAETAGASADRYAARVKQYREALEGMGVDVDEYLNDEFSSY